MTPAHAAFVTVHIARLRSARESCLAAYNAGSGGGSSDDNAFASSVSGPNPRANSSFAPNGGEAIQSAGIDSGQTGASLWLALAGNSPANPSSTPNDSAGSTNADGDTSATPPDTSQAVCPAVQSSWSPDQVNRGLLDGLKDDPLPSLGGDGANDPAPVETPITAQTGGQGSIAVKAPDPQTFAPVVRGLLNTVANQPLPVLNTGSNPQALLGAIQNGEGYADANGNDADYNALAGKAKGKSGQNFTGMTLRQAMVGNKRIRGAMPRGKHKRLLLVHINSNGVPWQTQLAS